MSMIPLGASSCAHKTISRSTEQWRIFVNTWFYLCVHFCHGKYMKVHETAIFHFTCSVMLQNFMHGYVSVRPVGLLRLFLSWSLGGYLLTGYFAGSRCPPGHGYGLLHHISCTFCMQDFMFGFDFGLGLLLQLCLDLGAFCLRHVCGINIYFNIFDMLPFSPGLFLLIRDKKWAAWINIFQPNFQIWNFSMRVFFG